MRRYTAKIIRHLPKVQPIRKLQVIMWRLESFCGKVSGLKGLTHHFLLNRKVGDLTNFAEPK